MASAVRSKPPLPVPQHAGIELMEELAEARTLSPSGVGNELNTSQKETISDGTILGLKDVFYQNEPDLTYYCAQCGRFIALLSLRDHKAYHNALTLLEFPHFPTSLRALIVRRNLIIKRLKEEAAAEELTLDVKIVQQLDDAYEILKQEMQDTFDSCRKVDEEIVFKVDSYDLACSVGCVSAVSHCSDSNSRWKSKMEDSKVYQDHFGNDPNKAFIALYNGHNGRYASAVAANELHYLLLRQISKFDKKISCKCTFNMLEENDISQFDLIRPPVLPCGHTQEIHKESNNFIQQVVYTCEKSDNNGTNHLSSHHPIMNKPSEESIRLLSSKSGHKVKDEYSEHMKAAFRMAYKLTDRVLAYGGDEKSRVRWSGCSAVTVLLESVEHEDTSIVPSVASEPVERSLQSTTAGDATVDGAKKYEQPRTVGRLHIANAGNCHAVLVRDNRSYLLTKPHTYDNMKERNRIINSGGFFSQSNKEMRVNGISLTTRGLGNHGDPSLKGLISQEPHCTTVPIDQYAQLLILATAGVWQVFTPQEAAELLLQILPQNRMPTPGYISPSIILLKHDEHESQHGKSPEQHCGNSLPAKLSNPPSTEEIVVPERKSSLSAQHAISPRKSRGHVASVTFQDEERTSAGERAGDLEVYQRDLNTGSDRALREEEEEEEDEELREIRSEDSGNEADVDTDWASTIPPNDLTLRSALSGQRSAHRYLSKLLAERLVQSALLAGAKNNISAVVVVLPGTKVIDI